VGFHVCLGACGRVWTCVGVWGRGEGLGELQVGRYVSALPAPIHKQCSTQFRAVIKRPVEITRVGATHPGRGGGMAGWMTEGRGWGSGHDIAQGRNETRDAENREIGGSRAFTNSRDRTYVHVHTRCWE
jgi:hypothetical protein